MIDLKVLIEECKGATDTKIAQLQDQVEGVNLVRLDGDCDSPAYEQCLIDYAGQLGTCSCPDGTFKKAG